MGFNNPDISWGQLEAKLSGRVPPVQADGGDGPGWSRKRGAYRAAPVERPAGGTVPYAELHCHSNYSFLDGASSPERLIEEAVGLGLSALALTDHDGFFGAARFAEAATAQGMRTVYGAELSLGLTAPQNGVPDPAGRHLLVLARGVEGYHELAGAITQAQLAGDEKGRPVYDEDDLADRGRDRWVVLTGCRKGVTTVADVRRLVSLFGADNVVVELPDGAHPTRDAELDQRAGVAADLGLATVATGVVHAARPADVRLAQAFAAVRARRSLADLDGWLAMTGFLRSGHEMQQRFARYPGAVATSVALAEETCFDLRKASPRLPTLEVPAGHTPMSWLRELVREGADRLYAHNREEAERRLQRELAVIEEKDFPGYFLIVHGIVERARELGILCQGRGSAANSAVCYAIGVTAVDSIRYGLPFERFLSAARNEEPDIDVDFDSDRREEIIQWVYDTYGRRNAAQVANVISYRPRSAVRDMAKALGYSAGQQDAWSKQIDSWTTIEPDPESMIPGEVLDLSRQALGAPRHLGIHSGGMVLTERPVGEVVPIERARMDRRTVLQWDKDDCAYMGLVKFDLLGLGMLGAIAKTFDLVAEHTAERWELATIPKEEAGVYDMLCLADSIGVFQVESRAQIGTLPRLRPRRFYDLVIEIALIRPGPIQGGAVHPYIRRRLGQEPVDHIHPALEPVLGRTLGVPLFQEQLMQIATTVGGCTGDEADLLRRAMGSKRGVEKIERLREKLYRGMADHQITGELADSIYARIEAFAHFGFAESHSISFALLVYASSWLKLHYPAAFLAGLLRSQPMGFYSPQSLVADARRHGVVTLRPDINSSGARAGLERLPGIAPAVRDECVAREQPPVPPFDAAAGFRAADHRRDGAFAVRLGLDSVQGIGPVDAERMVDARGSAPFTSMADVARRCGLSVTQTEQLATAGAFDCFGLSRRDAIWNAGYTDSAELLEGTAVSTPPPTSFLPGMTEVEMTLADLAATRISPAGHPVAHLRGLLQCHGVLSVADLPGHEPQRRIQVAGLITHRQRPVTASGVTFLNLEDETGMLNVVVFGAVWKRHSRVARNAAGVVVQGILEHNEGAVNLVAERLERIEVLYPESAGAIPRRHRARDFR